MHSTHYEALSVRHRELDYLAVSNKVGEAGAGVTPGVPGWQRDVPDQAVVEREENWWNQVEVEQLKEWKEV